MTPDQQRIAIAEACGWTDIRAQKIGNDRDSWGTKDGQRNRIPDYLNDLNAMHEAEKVLRNQFSTIEESYWRNLAHVQPHPIYATAAQRVEAFLRTLNPKQPQPHVHQSNSQGIRKP
jgi:hypothetical protein